ncbi:hypothetical protein [Aureimonas psammosilenae]|uniref:hypothetical protein n=1 Tax=Aureimonas psammosilenae TaxID=2495496 RepID=UPI001260A4C8|nr:hypothetical protein [Aureimonas psammosilenae]
MSHTIESTKRSAVLSTDFALSPLGVLFATLAMLAALSLVGWRLPIGPMYWDLMVYIDGGQRVLDGQIPNVDFVPPVGALGYWLFGAATALFPKAHPLLLADWSLLAVTAPPMALVIGEVDRRSRPLAFALLVPFLVFSILPFNAEFFYSYPGVDGFGIYNRNCARILYVLCAALVFCRNQTRLGAVISATMLALFLTKITGFLAGGIICAQALLAGRVRLRALVLSVGFCVLVLGALQLWLGMVGAYLKDIATLVTMNEGGIGGRFMQSASIHLDALAPSVLLVATLIVLGAGALRQDGLALLRRPSPSHVARFAERDAFAIGATILAAVFFEAQNTGSQAFIFLWPALLALLTRLPDRSRAGRIAVVTLLAASTLPTLVNVSSRAGRAFVGQFRYESLASNNLGPLGLVSQRPEVLKHAALKRQAYARFPEPYLFLQNHGELPSFTLYVEPDFQLAYLAEIDAAVDAVRLLEMAEGVRFETVMNLSFVNPFPRLLERHATKHISIGADPTRTVPAPDGKTAQAVRATDLVLYPKCPPTTANLDLYNLYLPFLGDHRRLALTPCWDAFMRNGLFTAP